MTACRDPMDPSVTDPIDPLAVVVPGGLATFEHRTVVASTMERAREMAADPACPLPAAIVADRQEMGRGQRGAGWWQAAGSLAVSVVVERRVEDEALPPPTWSLACGVTLAEAVAAVVPAIDALVRWPNDVEVAGKKLAGILVETAPGGRVVFGIGVNTSGSSRHAPPPLRRRIVTVPDLTGSLLPRQRLLIDFLPRLFGLLAAMELDPQAFLSRYRQRCSLDGHPVTVHQGPRRIAGLCRGVAVDGALVLETAAGPVHVHSGSLTDPADIWRRD